MNICFQQLVNTLVSNYQSCVKGAQYLVMAVCRDQALLHGRDSTKHCSVYQSWIGGTRQRQRMAVHSQRMTVRYSVGTVIRFLAR